MCATSHLFSLLCTGPLAHSFIFQVWMMIAMMIWDMGLTGRDSWMSGTTRVSGPEVFEEYFVKRVLV